MSVNFDEIIPGKDYLVAFQGPGSPKKMRCYGLPGQNKQLEESSNLRITKEESNCIIDIMPLEEVVI